MMMMRSKQCFAVIATQVEDFYKDEIQKLVVQYDMIFNIHGNYVKK